jgi:hypothetical protein
MGEPSKSGVYLYAWFCKEINQKTNQDEKNINFMFHTYFYSIFDS